MYNFDKLSLEYKNLVNNTNQQKLISNLNHNISIQNYENILKQYNFDSVDYIGFDLDSLNMYEDWLGDGFGRN